MIHLQYTNIERSVRALMKATVSHLSPALWKHMKRFLTVRSHYRRILLVCLCSSHSGLPEVTILPSNNKVQEGGNLTFECQVTGSPSPTVRWQTERLHSRHFIQVVENIQRVSLSGTQQQYLQIWTQISKKDKVIKFWKAFMSKHHKWNSRYTKVWTPNLFCIYKHPNSPS